MQIKKVKIKNFKIYKDFSFEFKDGINLVVGNNESGKSTLLEAIHLTLTGVINGKYLKNELSQYLFNRERVLEYLVDIRAGSKKLPPQILIEVYFGTAEHPMFKGKYNSDHMDDYGVALQIAFDNNYHESYMALIESRDLTTLPIEYYKIEFIAFSREVVLPRNIPLKSVLIDSVSNRYQNGSDIYIARIIQDDLEDKEKVGLSQDYRKLKQNFIESSHIKEINKKIADKRVSDKKLHISIDLESQNAWESILVTYFDNIPFHYAGKGEQCIIKTNLAMQHKHSQNANLILLEEPECHLSHTKLNQLLKQISENCESKQIIITTHSSFVANKLGLKNITLINEQRTASFADLTTETYNFFKKLAGYDTLRLMFCKKAVLVEGDSDELIFQKAYMIQHEGRLPIEDGIDVISVGLSFKRFLEVAQKIQKPVAVITDNDGDYQQNIIRKYEEYRADAKIEIFADNNNSLRTLEPQIVNANNSCLNALKTVLGLNTGEYGDKQELINYMTRNKTKCALKIFESSESLIFPTYIKQAVGWCNEQ